MYTTKYFVKEYLDQFMRYAAALGGCVFLV